MAELKRQKTKYDYSVAVNVLVKEFHEKGFNRDKFTANVMAVKSLCMRAWRSSSAFVLPGISHI